jgi:hypothetical protein
MAVAYDENVILTFAERRYRRAASMVIAYALFGAMVGALAGVGIAIATRTPGARRRGGLSGPRVDADHCITAMRSSATHAV